MLEIYAIDSALKVPKIVAWISKDLNVKAIYESASTALHEFYTPTLILQNNSLGTYAHKIHLKNYSWSRKWHS